MKRTRFLTNKQPLVPDAMDDIDSPGFLSMVQNEKYERNANKGFREREKENNRKLSFKNDFVRQVYYLAKLGAKDVDMAAFFGVHETTIIEWKRTNEDFNWAVLEGKWMFDFKVVESLGQRALGYDYEEVEYAQHVSRSGAINTLKKITKKHIPPDVTAIIFWLKNRQSEMWADVNKTEINANMQMNIAKKIDVTILTPEEQQFLKSIAIKKISTTHGISNN
jgi:hypothetical protein